MRINYEPSLSGLTTLHLGGKAIALLVPESRADLNAVSDYLQKLGGRPYNIGRGSNLLARDGILPITLLSMEKLDAIHVLDRDGEKVNLKVEAGVPLPRLLRFCLQHGLTGLEGLVGIPGSVGGACRMNAGSFGTVIGDYIFQIEILTPEGLKIIDKSHINFTYRNCTYPELFDFTSIVSIILTLTQAKKGGIFSRMNLNFINKKTRQPITSWSAGCAFKNPVSGPSAGILLDQAGLRGYKMGGMAFSPIHANFLINMGSGTAEAALELLEYGRMKVKNFSGLELENEVQIIPWP